MEMTNRRILVAGCGSIGLRHAQVLTGLGIATLAACDPSEQARAAFSARFPSCAMFDDYQRALNVFRPEAVFILTPTRLHIPMSRAALQHDCHVFIEKPLSHSPEGALELDALAKSRRKAVMVGFCFRYHTALLEAKRRTDSGAIGRLVSIRALMGEPFFEIHPNYLDLYYARYSGAFELVHDLDLAIWFAGQRVKRVAGVYGSFSDMGMESPDIVEMLLEFEDRCVANVHLDFFQSPRRRQIDLIGVNGVITVEFASWDEATLSTYTPETRQWTRESIATRRNDMFAAEDADFLECAFSGKPVRLDIAEALKSLEAICEIYRIKGDA